MVTVRILWHDTIFTNIIQEVDCIVDICFLFGKIENLKKWNLFRVFIFNDS